MIVDIKQISCGGEFNDELDHSYTVGGVTFSTHDYVKLLLSKGLDWRFNDLQQVEVV